MNRDEEEIEEDATMPLQANQNIVTLTDISPTGLGVALNKGTSLARKRERERERERQRKTKKASGKKKSRRVSSLTQ